MAKSKTLNITEIEDNLRSLIKKDEDKVFITEFLSFYDISKVSINRAKAKSAVGEPFIIKNKVYYTESEGDVVATIDAVANEIQDQKSKPRYIIANNFTDFAALDTQTGDTLNILFEELPAKADFFLAWNGIEKANYQTENPADRKAAERFAKLYDVIAKDNPNAEEHAFNVFLIRVLFLLFSEDTGIMKKGIFTNTLKTRTAEDGSDFNEVIEELFAILDVPETNRFGKDEWLLAFPYVNGKLFGEEHVPLTFTKLSRELLIEAGELLNWNEINPDILGAMIQSVASAEDRHVAGMHYTSVPNIMKVIRPLFLDELNGIFDSIEIRYEENEVKNITDKTRRENRKAILKSLLDLHRRISHIKFLDPASGSGNFLIIAYKEIRRLEIKIIQLEQKIERSDQISISEIRLKQFNGIEIDDFAHEVAKISLWIAEHQMNEEMVRAIPSANVTLLPLKDAGNIVCGNSLRIDWDEVVPHTDDDEVYIIGNPPYFGADKLDEDQKKDLDFVFKEAHRPKLDYISAWFYLGAKYIENHHKMRFSFVATNSINQGSQVSNVWSRVLATNVEIIFAYPSFKWNNSAKNNANVIVSIIGIANIGDVVDKKLYIGDTTKDVSNINAYLTEGPNIIVEKRTHPLSDFPTLIVGSRPNDHQYLILEEDAYLDEKERHPKIDDWTRKYIGGKQFINGTVRYCIWLPTKSDFENYKDVPIIYDRVNKLEAYRLQKADEQTQEKAKVKLLELANESYKFQNIRDADEIAWFIPQASSASRKYIPMGFIDKNTVAADPNFVIYSPQLWQTGVLLSNMHMVWMNAVSGKLKNDFRYSAEIVYNTFPIRTISVQRKSEIARVMLEILDLREYHGGTLAELYNKDTMPESLRKKHAELDGIVDRAYQQRPFESDEERLSTLLNLYKEMTENG